MTRGCARGFTLIELMVTLAIIALLATIVVPVAEINLQRQRENELRRALREIRTAIDAYKRASDDGRIAKPGDSSGYPPSLDVLERGVPDVRNPKGEKIFFLRRVPPDPLAAAESASPGDTWEKRSYASDPDAPQEGRDVFDVYSRSPSVGLNGVPYRKW